MCTELQKPKITEIKVRMDCNGCVQKIKKTLHGISGIHEIYVDFPKQKLTVIGWADPEKIVKAIRKTRKIATICSHDEQKTEPETSEDPGVSEQECPGATDLPQPEPQAHEEARQHADEVTPPDELPNNPPPLEIPAEESKTHTSSENDTSPRNQTGRRDAGDVHVIYHYPPNHGHRYDDDGHGYSSHWDRYQGYPQEPPNRYLGSHGFPHEPSDRYAHSSRSLRGQPARYVHNQRSVPEASVRYAHNPGNVPEPPVIYAYSQTSIPEQPSARYAHSFKKVPEPLVTHFHSHRSISEQPAVQYAQNPVSVPERPVRYAHSPTRVLEQPAVRYAHNPRSVPEAPVRYAHSPRRVAEQPAVRVHESPVRYAHSPRRVSEQPAVRYAQSQGFAHEPEVRYVHGEGLPHETAVRYANTPEHTQPVYVSHSYNAYRPSPYVTGYQPTPSPPRHSYHSRRDYTEDFESSNYGNGNIAGMFSDENPNACTVM